MWPHLCDLFWSRMAFMAFIAFLWFYMAFYDFIWQNNVFFRSLDPNSFRNLSLCQFFDREQRSKVLKEGLLLFLLAWNQVPIMYQIEKKLCKGAKNVQENKKCAREQKMFL